MYSSSADLRRGLARVLSLVVLDPEHDERRAWWTRVPESLATGLREGELGLEALVELLLEPELFAALERVCAVLGVAPLETEQVRAVARRAIISGRAHAAHLGRDIYGESNKALWDLVVAPLGAALEARWGRRAAEMPLSVARAQAPPAGVRALVEQLVAFETGPGEDGLQPCAAWLGASLRALGFELRVHERAGFPPVLEARRGARGLRGHVVLYGHYDTVAAKAERWTSDPDRVSEREGRWYARGIADNKGPLAARLWALEQLERSPALTWLIQGEEETGSVWAREVLTALVPTLDAQLWLDETGYYDHGYGTLRLLARKIGARPDSSDEPDPGLASMLDGLRVLAASAGLATRAELRGLNKSVVAGGCPFNHALPPGARYLAVGVNDSQARIHAHEESLPTWAFGLHREQLALVFEVVDRIAEGA